MQFLHKLFHRLKQDSQWHQSTHIRCPRQHLSTPIRHRVRLINPISSNRIVSSKQLHQSTIRRMAKISFHNQIVEVYSHSIMDLARCNHFLHNHFLRNRFHRNHLDHSRLDRNHFIHRQTSRDSSLCFSPLQYRCAIFPISTRKWDLPLYITVSK